MANDSASIPALEHLIGLLVEVDRHHRTGEASGNLSDDVIKRRDDGTWSIRFPGGAPSDCRKAFVNDPGAVRFVNVGQTPKPVDDLTSLGVILAHRSVAAGDRPAVTSLAGYRGDLADQITPSWWNVSADARRDRIIASLLRADTLGFAGVADLLRRHRVWLTLDPASGWRPVSLVRQWWPAAVVALTLLSLLVGLVLTGMQRRELAGQLDDVKNNSESINKELSEKLRGERKENLILSDENQTVREKLADANQSIIELRKEIEMSKGKPPPPTPETFYQTDPIVQNDLFKLYVADAGETATATRRTLQAGKIDRQTLEMILGTLRSYKRAGELFWQYVDDQLTDEAVQVKVEALDDDVARHFRRWRAAMVQQQHYDVQIRSLVAEQYPDDWHRVSLLDMSKYVKPAADDPPGSGLEYQEGDPTFNLPWKLNAAIPLYVERYGWTYNKDLLTGTIGGAYALHRLIRRRFKGDEEVQVSFKTTGELPGPSMRVLSANLPAPAEYAGAGGDVRDPAAPTPEVAEVPGTARPPLKIDPLDMLP